MDLTASFLAGALLGLGAADRPARRRRHLVDRSCCRRSGGDE